MKFFIAILFISIFLFESCSDKKKYVLSSSKMVNVISDLHFADAMGMGLFQKNLDSAEIYNWVFEKNAVTRAEFDSSMIYYANHSDKFNEIYEKVLSNLQKKQEETRLKITTNKENNVKVLFESKKTYRLPFDSPSDKIPFEVALSGPGEYTIEAKVKVFNIDQSVNPHITVYFWYDDGTPDGGRDYFRLVRLKKDNRVNTYVVSEKLTGSKYQLLKGYILDDDNTNLNFIKHAEVYSIKVSYAK